MVKELQSHAVVDRTLTMQWRGIRSISTREMTELQRNDEVAADASAHPQVNQGPFAPLAEVWVRIRKLGGQVPEKPDQAVNNEKNRLIVNLRDSLIHDPSQLQALNRQINQQRPESIEATIALAAIHNAGLPEGLQLLTDLLDSRSQDIRWVDRVVPILGFSDKPTEQTEQALRGSIQDARNMEAVHTSMLALDNLASRLEEGSRKESLLRELGERLGPETDPFMKKSFDPRSGQHGNASGQTLCKRLYQYPGAVLGEAATTVLGRLHTS